jgi:hypothetical protein
MNDQYKIIDTRPIESFKTISFSGYKKSDVINSVLKSIETKKIESACHWCCECILSGYTLLLWDKLISFYCKIIYINNPNVPNYLYKKNQILMNQISHLGKSKENILLLRNSQMIRNLLFDVVSTLTVSSKTKRYVIPKINEKEDFLFHNIQKRLCAQMNILPSHIMHFNDPDELRIILNEIFTLLKNNQFGFEKSCYWIFWILKWENIHKKNKKAWTLDEREINDIPKKYRADIIWALWETILEETKIRNNKNLTKQILSLFSLFKYNYSVGKRNSRITLLLNAVAYLTNTINFNTTIRPDYKTFIQVQGNVNKMFLLKKSSEVKTTQNIEISVKKSKKKKDDIDLEISHDKISMFNELDSIIMGM